LSSASSARTGAKAEQQLILSESTSHSSHDPNVQSPTFTLSASHASNSGRSARSVAGNRGRLEDNAIAGLTPLILGEANNRRDELLEVEVINSAELARRLGVPESWVRSRSNPNRTGDPIPHYKFGRYVQFPWGSEVLRAWLNRQLVSTDRAGHSRRNE